MRLHQVFSSFFGHGKGPARHSDECTVHPHLEVLEDRTTPTVFTNQAFVAAAYQAFLGHSPDSTGLSFWTNELNAGATPTQVVSGILASTEYRGREVASLYPSLLGRPADLSGLNLFTSALISGASLDQVKAALIASDEFFNHAGGTPAGFLNSLYMDVLGRPVDQSGLTMFGPAAASGQSDRYQVALDVLKSPEAETLKLQNDYQEILGQPLNAAGQALYGSALASGARDEAVLAELFGSPAFFANLQTATAGATNPLTAATAFANQFNLFQIGVGPNGMSTGTANGGAGGQFGQNTAAVGGLQPTAAQMLGSPAFGVLNFPAGFDATQPGTSIGLFGPNGFIPAVPTNSPFQEGLAAGNTPQPATLSNANLAAALFGALTPGGLNTSAATLGATPGTGILTAGLYPFTLGGPNLAPSPFGFTTTAGTTAGYNASMFTGFGQPTFEAQGIGSNGYINTSTDVYGY